MNVDKTIERSAGHRLTVSGGRLVVETGPSAGRDVALDREALVIGRAPGNGLVLDDPAVSATHCELVATEGDRFYEIWTAPMESCWLDTG
jgi:pSer/pThr/pTyr-binding forkhead associated (FHA) protein